MSEKLPRSKRQLSGATRGVVAAVVLLLPSLSLVPLGGLYLWQHGLLLWWAGASLVIVGVFSVLLRRLLRPASRLEPSVTVEEDEASDPHWSEEEERAWKDVVAIAARVDVERMNDPNYFLELGQGTLNAVARRLHPEKTDAVWQFTLPEALAISERVSRRLGGFVVESVPFGDRLTVAQLLAAYRWRGAFDVAERAYDIWRILRIVNPATAVTNEARERLSRAVYNYGKEHVSRRIAEAYVEEIGKAAIDLYGGRLTIAQKLTSGAAGGHDGPLGELAARHVALMVAVGGGTRSERLALASMTGEALDKRGLSAAVAEESALTTFAEPEALKADSLNLAAVTEELRSADVVLWILRVEDQDQDAKALATLAATVHADNAGSLPLLFAVRLHDTADEAAAAIEQSTHMAQALAQALGVRPPAVMPVFNLNDARSNGVTELVGIMAEQVGRARRVHIQRVLSAARRSSSWVSSARQAVKAAGALTRAVVRKR